MDGGNRVFGEITKNTFYDCQSPEWTAHIEEKYHFHFLNKNAHEVSNKILSPLNPWMFTDLSAKSNVYHFFPIVKERKKIKPKSIQSF